MVKFIHCTPDAEKHIAYCARVSSPKNQENTEISKLLSYCIEHKHFSIFEMATLCVEVTTTRAIATQILRHRSFNFQEFSQRYSEVSSYISCEAREQDNKNRQNSTDTLSDNTKIWFANAQEDIWKQSKSLYDQALKQGVAKESARFLLPLNTSTTLYMHGNLRSFIHYIELRESSGTQEEHRQIALQIKYIFSQQFPVITKGLGWNEIN